MRHRSEVRRLRVGGLEQVQHRHTGQEWVPHWHEDWSFGAIVAGCCRCSVAGRPFVARTGDLIAVAPGVVHTGALGLQAPQSGVLVTMLYVPAAWLADAGLGPPARSGQVRAPALCRAARSLDHEHAAHNWLQQAVPALSQALQPKADQGSEVAASHGMRQLIARVQTGVLAGEHTVAGLARHCAVSRERMHRVLVQSVGMAPGDYLRGVRLQRARLQVLEGAPLAEVAADCGFADQAHFTRWFRRSFGYTPGDLALAEQG